MRSARLVAMPEDISITEDFCLMELPYRARLFSTSGVG